MIGDTIDMIQRFETENRQFYEESVEIPPYIEVVDDLGGEDGAMSIEEESNNAVEDHNDVIGRDNTPDNAIENVGLVIISEDPSLCSRRTSYYDYKTLSNYGKQGKYYD